MEIPALIFIIIGSLATVISLFGAVYYFISLSHLKGNESLSIALTYVAVASYIWILYTLFGFYLVLTKIEAISSLWIIVIFGHLITSIAYFIGSYKMETFFKKLK